MDLILLPPSGLGPGEPGEPLASPLGGQRLDSLAAWLLDRGEHVRTFAFLPREDGPGRRWLLDFLEGQERKYGVEAAAILPPEGVTLDLLGALHARGIFDLVLLAGAGGFEALLEALATVERHRAGRAAVARSGRALSCRVWLQEGDDGEDWRRRLRLSRAAPWAEVDTPAFDLPAGTALGSAGLPPLPAGLRARAGGCWLFETSLTVDGAGRGWFCSRHAAGEVPEGRLGDLFADTPEELMARKQAGRAGLGRTAACRRCGLRARFQWPEPERPRGAEEPAPPRRAEAGAAAARGLEVVSREVTVEHPEEAKQALDAFAARLEAWSTEEGDGR